MIKILAYIESHNNNFKKSSLGLISFLKNIFKGLDIKLDFLVINSLSDVKNKELHKYGAENLIFINNDEINSFANTEYILYSHSAIAKIISDLIIEKNYNLFILLATSFGLEIAPKIAIKTESVYISDCTSFEIKDGMINVIKPICSGNYEAIYKLCNERVIISLRPNFKIKEYQENTTCNFIKLEKEKLKLEESDFKVLTEKIIYDTNNKNISDSDIVISGGLGMQNAENFRLIEELAEILNGAVGASRAVVDKGWRPHSEQVGQTGKTISPTLYIACGISGSLQHLAGMSKSKYIVAINKDENAPIFKISDFGIVGDALEILPALITEIKKYK
ncbi:MAG: electron transfer flavoprotein subunit alpha/FixB family protein [Ignavibacteria bacterium]|nr:electron transfer flavoprotein subunit alpha/FixB family protein [Ignavibacteria bacterium]